MRSCSLIGSERRDKRQWNALTLFPSIVLMETIVHIVDVRCVENHRLRLTFEDGKTGELDFSGEEWKGVFEPLRDPSFFRQVELDEELGTIVWPNGADFAPETLHRMVVEQRGSTTTSS
jgi:Protein of unknown function (DUF2442)